MYSIVLQRSKQCIAFCLSELVDPGIALQKKNEILKKIKYQKRSNIKLFPFCNLFADYSTSPKHLSRRKETILWKMKTKPRKKRQVPITKIRRQKMRSASNIRMKNVKDENSLAELTKHRGNPQYYFAYFFS